MTHLYRALLLSIAVFGMLGCSSAVKAPQTADDNDPWESANRRIYKFNDAIDKAVLKPVTKAYDKVMPKPVDKGIDNVLGNLGDVFTLANDILQLKVTQSLQDFTRIFTNTTFGLGGIFDVASSFDLEKHNEDFGQTLGYWGVPEGPYLVLPLMGPSDLRDSFGLGMDGVASSALLTKMGVDEFDERATYTAVSVINRRQALLGAEQLLEASGADPYIFIRESYLQRRKSLVNDGVSVDDELDADEEDALFGDDE